LLEIAADDAESAARSLDQSLWLALGAGHTSVAARASAKVGHLRAVRLGQLERAQTDLPVTDGLCHRMRDDVELFAECLDHAGQVHAAAGRRREALRLLESARDLRVKHGREQTLAGLATLTNLAAVAQAEGQYDVMERSLRRLVAASHELLGPTHPATLSAEAALARGLRERGRPQPDRE
jgi:hypothetical protein